MKAMILCALLVPAVALAQQPKDARGWLNEGIARQKAGKLDAAAEAYQHLLDVGALVPIAAYNLATVHAAKGEVDKAFAMLEKSFNAGFARFDEMKADPDLARLAKDPRWPAELDKLDKIVHPCLANPLNRQLDFWIGEWDVFAPQGYQVGTSSVQRILGGCVIFENWSGRLGGEGKSFNFYDAVRKQWQQTYIDDKGTVLEITGHLDGSAMHYESEIAGADGKKTRQRLTFTPQADGRVRQLWETSDDGGKTWSTIFDGFYKRKSA